MTQSETEPEYILEEKLERTSPLQAPIVLSLRNWDQLVVELEQSIKACDMAVALLGNITSSLQVSVQSLREQV